MKPILFLIFLITVTTTITVGQTRTRDVLFPHFAEDKAKLEAKEKKGDHTLPRQQGHSTKESIFTSYKPQSAGPKARPLGAQARKQSKATPSDMSVQTALEQQQANKATGGPQPLTLPTQGEEPKADLKTTNGQLKKH